MTRFSFLVFRFSFCFLLLSCTASDLSPLPNDWIPEEGREYHEIVLSTPKGNPLTMMVEIADEPREQAQGLMHRTDITPGTGMLFVFERERRLSFWMRNVPMSLDILFFDAQGNYVDAFTMLPCDPQCQSYYPKANAQYALETREGFIEEFGVGEGWLLQLADW